MTRHAAPAPPPHRRPQLALAVGLAPLAALAALWWSSTDPAALTSLGGLLTGASRLTGLAAGWVLLAQLLSLARIPWWERSVGADRVSRWHAVLGASLVATVGVHAATAVTGYALVAHAGIAGEVFDMVTGMPHLVAATVAAGALLAVGVSSCRAVRARLGYGRWHLAHLSAYPVTWLSFGHEVATGEQFAGHRLASAVWTATTWAAAACVVAFRVVRPLVRSLRHRLTVAAVVHESPDTVSLWLRGRHLERLGAQAGQFFLWRFATPGLWAAAHPYSLSTDPAGGLGLRITVKGLGDASRRVAGVPVGTRVLFEGPFGGGAAPGRRPTVLLAAGVGITPLRAVAERLSTEGVAVDLLYRVRTPADVLFGGELDVLGSRPGVRVRVVAGSRREVPVTALLAAADGLAGSEVYVCGPQGFADEVADAARHRGVPAQRVHRDGFGW